MLHEVTLLTSPAHGEVVAIEARGAVPAIYCQGHFPGLPIAPLGALGMMVASAAGLLLNVRDGTPGARWLTVGIESVQTGRTGVRHDEEVTCCVRLECSRHGMSTFDTCVLDAAGQVVAALNGLRMVRVRSHPSDDRGNSGGRDSSHGRTS